MGFACLVWFVCTIVVLPQHAVGQVDDPPLEDADPLIAAADERVNRIQSLLEQGQTDQELNTPRETAREIAGSKDGATLTREGETQRDQQRSKRNEEDPVAEPMAEVGEQMGLPHDAPDIGAQ